MIGFGRGACGLVVDHSYTSGLGIGICSKYKHNDGRDQKHRITASVGQEVPFECIDQVHIVLLIVPKVCQSSTLSVFFVHRSGEERWFSIDGVMRRSARVGRASSRVELRDEWHHHRTSHVATWNSG